MPHAHAAGADDGAGQDFARRRVASAAKNRTVWLVAAVAVGGTGGSV
jgi:hypothetical protein